MEPPPRFNLEQAIAAWRLELASHPGPAPEDVRVLEAHLRDGFAEVRRQGHGEAEAFQLARSRLGQPAAVAAEFAKIAPGHVWTRQVFWLAFGLLGAQLWKILFPALLMLVFQGAYLASVQMPLRLVYSILIQALIYAPPVIMAAVWLARGVPRPVARLFSSRERVAVASISTSLIVICLYLWCRVQNPIYSTVIIISRDVIEPLYWPLFLIGVMIWLAPGRGNVRAGRQDHQSINEKASFITSQRTGTPGSVVVEFVPVASGSAWSLRVFWLASGLLAAQLWYGALDFAFQHMIHYVTSYSQKAPGGEWRSDQPIYQTLLHALLYYAVPLMIAGYWLARGAPQVVTRMFSTRGRVAAVSLSVSGFWLFLLFATTPIRHSLTNGYFFETDNQTMFWPLLALLLYYIAPVMLMGLWLVRGAPRSVGRLLLTPERVFAVCSGVSGAGIFLLFYNLLKYYNYTLNPIPSNLAWAMMEPFLGTAILIGMMVWLAPGGTKARVKTA